MANSLLPFLRNSYITVNYITKINHLNIIKALSIPIMRPLYSQSTLGIDGFISTREKVKHQVANVTDNFKEKMLEYCKDDSKNMIFTEDLKNMVHIAETDEDIDLVIQMMKRYSQQNKALRFGSYIFGPVVMRMFYICGKADLAYECFKSPQFTGFFEQLMTYQILLDLLYENQKYKEVLEALEIIKDRQIEGTKYPRNAVVLALAACYRLNSEESLNYALNLWKELQAVGHNPMRRAVTFCAALALNQNRPEVALEIVTMSRNQSYTTVRNIKVAALADVGRIEGTLPILKFVLSDDRPTSSNANNISHTFNKDVIHKLRGAVEKLDNAELKLEFNRIFEMFEKQGLISTKTLEENLLEEIQKPPNMYARDMSYQTNFDQRHSRRSGDVRRNNHPFGAGYRRPGLNELV